MAMIREYEDGAWMLIQVSNSYFLEGLLAACIIFLVRDKDDFGL